MPPFPPPYGCTPYRLWEQFTMPKINSDGKVVGSTFMALLSIKVKRDRETFDETSCWLDLTYLTWNGLPKSLREICHSWVYVSGLGFFMKSLFIGNLIPSWFFKYVVLLIAKIPTREHQIISLSFCKFVGVKISGILWKSPTSHVERFPSTYKTIALTFPQLRDFEFSR